MQFFEFAAHLKVYLEDGARDPRSLRPFLHKIAPNLRVEDLITDRHAVQSLSRYPIRNWCPESWIEGREAYGELMIHDGARLNPRIEAVLLDLLGGLQLNSSRLGWGTLQDLFDNNEFKMLRSRLWTSYEASEDEVLGRKLERDYQWCREIGARQPVIRSLELQMRFEDEEDRVYELRDIRGILYEVAANARHLLGENGSFVICPRCGVRDGEDGPCTRSRCPGFEGWMQEPYDDSLLVLKRAHQQRIFVPAMAEIELYDELRGMIPQERGTVQLWPGVDRFDIYVIIDGFRIAIDVKDWESISQLSGEGIERDIPNYPPYEYDLGIYAYPTGQGLVHGSRLEDAVRRRLARNQVWSTARVIREVRRRLR